MSYRPQFAFPTPDGYKDEEFVEYFDPTNTPGLAVALAAGQSMLGVPLLLEPGIEYHIRGIEVASGQENPLGVRFTDPYGDRLSDEFVPIGTYFGGQGSPPGGTPVVFEGEMICPPGGIITVDVKHLS